MAPNLTASIQDRLKNQSRKDKINFATLLEQFALSRFFARLSESTYNKKFILKGAQLFRLWSDQVHRPTRDADFLSFGTINPEKLETIFNEICNLDPAEPDALKWLEAQATPIREENTYGGIRVKITAILGNMKIPLQIDVGYGDIITPAIKQEEWQSILDFKNISLQTYPVETVIAEKLEAMVSLGMANSRMKAPLLLAPPCDTVSASNQPG